jgi:hypothetical protein
LLPEFGAKPGNPVRTPAQLRRPEPALGKLCLQYGHARFARLKLFDLPRKAPASFPLEVQCLLTGAEFGCKCGGLPVQPGN